ncbi:MAG: M3 family oligoendopeptidase [Acholeplasmataceae bacterium]
MTFNEYIYKRPDVKKIGEELQHLINEFAQADANRQEQIIRKSFKIMDEVSSMAVLASIRHTVDTKDEFYLEERKYLDENQPLLSKFANDFNQLAFNSVHKDHLVKAFGQYFFDQIEVGLKAFDEKMIPLLIEENKLSTEYDKLIASAQIEFEGKTYTLTQMSPFIQHINRDTRHKAQLKVSGFFKENEDKIDEIYDKLVKVRHEMALIKGYENFIELGYYRMDRTDYNHEDVYKYREQIKEVVVPAVSKLHKRKSKRLGIKDLKSYDTIAFLSGNPTPKGTKDELVSAAKLMYKEMSKETDEFFSFMLKHDLFDLESKPGKRGGGYCTYIPKYESPFIFANFNGTAHDVDVLTHEAGHAFQVYSSRHHIPSQRWPGMEGAEIHSMSMEFFAWPWIDKFFKEDAKKYYFTHLSGAISFLPYGALVDEFQHEVYKNPSMTPEERKQTWRRLEKIYLPNKDYDDDSFMEKGTYWYRQGHIFSSPFYYIDYTLAQVVAFQYWILNRENHEKAWQSYYKLCTLGGTKGFVGLIEESGLNSPFIEGTIKKTIKPLMAFLDSIDDTKL